MSAEVDVRPQPPAPGQPQPGGPPPPSRLPSFTGHYPRNRLPRFTGHYPRNRLPSLTGLRIFGSVAVVLCHVGNGFASAPSLTVAAAYGYAGVSFFFMLSGFVLTWSDTASPRAGSGGCGFPGSGPCSCCSWCSRTPRSPAT